MTTLLGIALIAAIVAIDNALLAGLLLPMTPIVEQRLTMVVVGVLLALSQIVLAASVDMMLDNLWFRVAAIVLLGWMCIRTLGMVEDPRRSLGRRWIAIGKLWIYTSIGNLDNMLWLGSVLKGEHVWLVIFSIATIPLFVIVALFLSRQCEQQKWILPLGAGMMAWASTALILDFPGIREVIEHLVDAPRTTFQCLITLCILGLGIAIRQIGRYRSLHR